MTIVCVDITPIMLQSLEENACKDCMQKMHAKAVMRLKPSGYLTKEATNAPILEELHNLRYPVAPPEGRNLR